MTVPAAAPAALAVEMHQSFARFAAAMEAAFGRLAADLATMPPALPPVVTPAIAAPNPEPPAAMPSDALRSPALSARLPRRGTVWSPERRAVLAREYPAGTAAAAIAAMLDELPGPSIPRKRIAIQAAAMKLRRPVAAPAPASQAPPSAAVVPLPAATRPPDFAPVPTTAETARRWGAERGLDPLRCDIEAINAKRRHLGLPPFVLPARPAPAPRPR